MSYLGAPIASDDARDAVYSRRLAPDPERWRSRFLEAVVDALLGRPCNTYETRKALIGVARKFEINLESIL